MTKHTTKFKRKQNIKIKLNIKNYDIISVIFK